MLATENQQAILNDVIEVKWTSICIKFKQKYLRLTKNALNWNS